MVFLGRLLRQEHCDAEHQATELSASVMASEYERNTVSFERQTTSSRNLVSVQDPFPHHTLHTAQRRQAKGNYPKPSCFLDIRSWNRCWWKTHHHNPVENMLLLALSAIFICVVACLSIIVIVITAAKGRLHLAW